MVRILVRKFKEMATYLGICGYVWKDLYGEESGGRFSVATVEVRPFKASTRHYHRLAHEVYKLLEGECMIEVGDQAYEVTACDVIYIPNGVAHRIKNASGVRTLLVVFSSPPFSEGDTFCV